MSRRRVYVFGAIILVGILIGLFCLPDSGKPPVVDQTRVAADGTGSGNRTASATDDAAGVRLPPADLAAAAAEGRAKELLEKAATSTDARAALDGLTKAYEASPNGRWGGEAAAHIGFLYNRSGNPANAKKWFLLAKNTPLPDAVRARVDAALEAIDKAAAAPAISQIEMVPHKVQPGDSLWKIARQYATSIGSIRSANKLANDMLQLGSTLNIPKGPFDVRVSKSTHMLFLLQDGKIVKTYSVGLGAPETPTPTGEWVVQNKLTNPVWYSPQGRIPYGDPRNVLGSRWIGFSGRYGIHGTRQQDENTIGQSTSNGCVRLRDADVQELYDFLIEGKSKVSIVE